MTSEDTAARGSGGAPTGSVAEEAALLVDLLAARGWGTAGHGKGAPTESGAPADATASAGAAPGDDRGGRGERTARTERAERAERAGTDAHECTCGGRTPAACTVCPVCQLIAFVQRIEPDAIDRFADVVGLAATALRDLATAQRERRDRAADATGGDDEGAAE